MPSPDFLCIGTQKSGTTWLYKNLEKHDEVWTPPIKEFHYFNRMCMNDKLLGDWGMPISKRDAMYWEAIKYANINNLRWLRNYYELGLTKFWYQSLFHEKFTKGKVCGDMTPGYTTLEERGVRYARDVVGQDTPVILTIRNPINRSWSAAKMLFRHYGLSIDDDINTKKLLDLLKSPDITLCSEYTRIIPLWKKYFNNFYVLTYDELCQDPYQYLLKISEILNIENKWCDDTVSKIVWADAKKIKLPPAIRQCLIEQYSEEIEATIKLVDNDYVAQWKADV